MRVRVTAFQTGPMYAGAPPLPPGITAWVPLGSTTKNSPMAIVTHIHHPTQSIKNLRSIRVTFNNGHTVEMSTRQKVDIVEYE